MRRPPCWPDGQPCPNPCASDRYDRTVYAKQDLSRLCAGWRTEARRDAARNRSKKRVSRKVVTVVRIANDDWHLEGFATVTG